MTDRERLPNRRPSLSFTFELNGLAYTATVSRFVDGRLGEVFLASQRLATSADTNARDAAIAFSFALQHGADAEAIRRALSRDGRGQASGPLGRALDLLLAEQSP